MTVEKTALGMERECPVEVEAAALLVVAAMGKAVVVHGAHPARVPAERGRMNLLKRF